MLLPVKQGGTIAVRRSKYASYDVYLGITARYLLIAECGTYKHFYEYGADAEIDPEVVAVTEVRREMSLNDMGTCYPLSEIRRCGIKKGWMGAVKCHIVMKNGDYFELILPKRGGHGGGMLHHEQYRDEIIACLSALHSPE